MNVVDRCGRSKKTVLSNVNKLLSGPTSDMSYDMSSYHGGHGKDNRL
jgi:hypothetical protein